jgi:DNA-binding NarL/FixJ family response regulator
MTLQEQVIRVVIVDRQTPARIGTRKILEQTAGITVVGETDSGRQALRLARAQPPDVVVTETESTDLSGLQLAAQLKPIPVLIYSAYEEERFIRHFLENGLAGYLSKRDAPQHLIAAVRGLAQGEENWLSPRLARRAMTLERQNDAATQLDDRRVTPRERDVLRLIAKGLSNQQIADRLHIAKNTVRSHVSSLYKKLAVRSRREAMAWAWEHGLLRDG